MSGDNDSRFDFLEIWTDYSTQKAEAPARRKRRRPAPLQRGGMIRPGVRGNLVAAESLLKKERFDEALVRLERVLTQEPDHREALFRAALLRKRLGLMNDALRSLDRLIELEPDFPGLRYERRSCHHKMGNWTEAMEDLELYVHLARGNSDEKRFVKKAMKLHADAEKRRSR